MIITVTLNAALDITYTVPELRPHATHRVSAVAQRAGGKGVNVASVLHVRGVPVLATGLLGGEVGKEIRTDLDVRGVAHTFANCDGPTRRAVTVVSESVGDATVFNEPGPTVEPGEWEAFRVLLARLIRERSASVVVAAGSLPPGAPGDAYAQVVRLAHDSGCRTVVDASGAALLSALGARPDVVKPNRQELAEATDTHDLVEGAQQLQRLGAHDVIVSAGADGLVLVERDGQTMRAKLPDPLRGNPTGAGDAAVAAVASGLSTGAPWTETLAEALVWSAAAVLHPLAGQVRGADIEKVRAAILLDPPAAAGAEG